MTLPSARRTLTGHRAPPPWANRFETVGALMSRIGSPEAQPVGRFPGAADLPGRHPAGTHQWVRRIAPLKSSDLAKAMSFASGMPTSAKPS